MFTKQDREVLNKIKKVCKETKDCTHCKYFESYKCVFDKDMPMNWEVDVNER